MPDNDWFMAVSMLRRSLERPPSYTGTVFAGPGPVAPLPDPLGGDSRRWPLLQLSAAKDRRSFFAILQAKAHFLLLPKRMVAAIAESSDVDVSEADPGPGAQADAQLVGTLFRRVLLRLPGASEALAKVGHELGRPTTSDVKPYELLSWTYHELTHAWLYLALLGKVGDSDVQKLHDDGLSAYASLRSSTGEEIDALGLFSELAAQYVEYRVFRWCITLHHLDRLLRARSQNAGDVQAELQILVDGYDRPWQSAGGGSWPELSPTLRDALDRVVLDRNPLTRPFVDTPLDGLRARLLS